MYIYIWISHINLICSYPSIYSESHVWQMKLNSFPKVI